MCDCLSQFVQLLHVTVTAISVVSDINQCYAAACESKGAPLSCHPRRIG